jgi:cytochrome P450
VPDDFDLFADTTVGDVRDPYPELAAARRDTPVLKREVYNAQTFMVFRYADVGEVLRDPETFSSTIYARGVEMVMGPTILGMDAPEHVRKRALVAGAFRRKALETWAHSLIEPTVHTLIDRFVPRGEADLVREFTFRYPITIIARMLGIPPGDDQTFARLSIELISLAVDFGRGMAASRALGDYFKDLIDVRRKEPEDDLISSLATAEVEGRRLEDEEILGFLRLLLPAGAETTYRLLGNLLFALLSDPPQLEALRADASLAPAAIEEALRWEAPVQFVARRAMRDTRIAGVDIPEGSSVTCSLGSANRDETVFADPDRYDLARDAAHHVAFAEGPHRCLGEHLARLETTAALTALLERLPDLRLDPGDRDPHVHGMAFRSPTCLPVRFTPA